MKQISTTYGPNSTKLKPKTNIFCTLKCPLGIKKPSKNNKEVIWGGEVKTNLLRLGKPRTKIFYTLNVFTENFIVKPNKNKGRRNCTML